MSKVVLSNISKKYNDGTLAVKDIDLVIPDKDLAVIVGPSGCGKTTLLRLISGLDMPTTGEILIDDEVVNDLTPFERHVSMLFQDHTLYPNMDVAHNIGFPLKMKKIKKDIINEKIKNISELLGINDILDKHPDQLSGGQRHRAAMAKLLVSDAKVLLFDEPLSDIDANMRSQMRSDLLKLHNKMNTTSVYVTHDQNEAMSMADMLVVMENGTIQQIGTPQEIYDHPVNKYVAGFIGSPKMNFMDMVLTSRDGTFYLQSGDIRLDLPHDVIADLERYKGLTLTVGIRPEDIIIREKDDKNSISSIIDMIEYIGSDKYLYFKIYDDSFVIRTSKETKIEKGSKILFTPKIKKLHLFLKEKKSICIL